MSKLKHSFKYTKAGGYKRPLIPITLRNDKKDIGTVALIDSGADLNIFHADLAILLGLDLSKLKEQEFGGIKNENGTCKGYLAVIEIGVNNDFYSCGVLFSHDISDNGYGILGQRGFFEHFKVTLDYKTDRIYLK